MATIMKNAYRVSPYRGHSGVLVIVDMQPDYEASSASWLLTKVRNEITQARFAEWAILFLEFAGKSPTHPQLLKPVQKPIYERFFVLKKETADGSEKILSQCSAEQFDTSLIRVCGVNSHECVQETVSSLSLMLPLSRIEVITEACNCNTGRGWRSFKKAPNVILRGLKSTA